MTGSHKNYCRRQTTGGETAQKTKGIWCHILSLLQSNFWKLISRLKVVGDFEHASQCPGHTARTHTLKKLVYGRLTSRWTWPLIWICCKVSWNVGHLTMRVIITVKYNSPVHLQEQNHWLHYHTLMCVYIKFTYI